MFVYFADLAPRLGCVTAAIAMHAHLLYGVIRLPITFFDTTPVGRILSRFSSDTDIVDNRLADYLSDGIYCVFEVSFHFHLSLGS